MIHESSPAQKTDYSRLPIVLPSLASLSLRSTHYIYFKIHQPAITTPESSRSLFLVNIPIDSTTEHLKKLWSSQLGLPEGRIQSVEFEDNPTRTQSLSSGGAGITIGKKSKKRKRTAELSTLPPIENTLPATWNREIHSMGSTAILVFVDKASLDSATRAARAVESKGSKIVWGHGLTGQGPALGSQRRSSDSISSNSSQDTGYTRHEDLMFPPRDVLLKAVNNYMTEFNVRQEAAAKELARKRSMPDEDGFITVVRGGRNAAARMEDAKEKLEKQKERQKGLNDFYRFQGREARKEKAAQLVKRFEEDKERIRKMKTSRKSFQPE